MIFKVFMTRKNRLETLGLQQCIGCEKGAKLQRNKLRLKRRGASQLCECA